MTYDEFLDKQERGVTRAHCPKCGNLALRIGSCSRVNPQKRCTVTVRHQHRFCMESWCRATWVETLTELRDWRGLVVR